MVVARATGSARLTAPVDLTRLWASIPQIDLADGLGAGLPDAIVARPVTKPGDVVVHPAVVDWLVLEVPEADMPFEEGAAAFARRMQSYPEAAGVHIRKVVDGGPGRKRYVVDFMTEDPLVFRPVATLGQPLFSRKPSVTSDRRSTRLAIYRRH